MLFAQLVKKINGKLVTGVAYIPELDMPTPQESEENLDKIMKERPIKGVLSGSSK